MSITEIVALVRDAIVGAAAAVTATVAVIGLSNWNRELKGKATFDVARGLARSTYKLRDEIRNCRSPFLAASEFPEGSGSGRSPKEEAQRLAHVYGNRWKFVWEALQEFDTNTLEAEAIWGSEVRAKTDALRQCVRELRVAIDAMIQDAASGGEDFRSDREFGKEIRSKVSTASGAANELTQRIDAAIQGIESVVRPHLKRG